MPHIRRLLIHSNGPALWPEHKPLEEVLALKDSTPESVWLTTYQGETSASETSVFSPDWFIKTNRRFDPLAVGEIKQRSIRRFISFDTAERTKTTSAWTAWAVGELMPDYRLAIVEVGRRRVGFPQLLPLIEEVALSHLYDGKLESVIIEDASSGVQAVQTFQGATDSFMADLIVPYQPTVSKLLRAQQASVWCKNGSILLPLVSPNHPWVEVFLKEFFKYPNTTFADQADAVSQLINFTQHLLSAGFRARNVGIGMESMQED